MKADQLGQRLTSSDDLSKSVMIIKDVSDLLDGSRESCTGINGCCRG